MSCERGQDGIGGAEGVADEDDEAVRHVAGPGADMLTEDAVAEEGGLVRLSQEAAEVVDERGNGVPAGGSPPNRHLTVEGAPERGGLGGDACELK